MPAETRLETLPVPNNPAVSLRAIPEQLVAVKGFSGRWTKANCQQQHSELSRLITEHGYQPAGAPRFARFNPPWTPWFMRRNEIQIPITHKN